MLIFTRKGECIFHLDLTEKLDLDNLVKISARKKLIFGLLLSLSSYVKMLSANEFKSYTTDRYKLHTYELLTGVKFVIISSPKVTQDLTQVLKDIYVNLYIPFLSKNIAYKLGSQIKCKYFKESIISELTNYH